jgi:hypothetical protein
MVLIYSGLKVNLLKSAATNCRRFNAVAQKIRFGSPKLMAQLS